MPFVSQAGGRHRDRAHEAKGSARADVAGHLASSKDHDEPQMPGESGRRAWHVGCDCEPP
jgi:hypothetical protein